MDLEIIKTCECSPEQYDVYIKEDGERKIIGYMKLRWGTFTVSYPNVSGECIYSHSFSDAYKGMFSNEGEKLKVEVDEKEVAVREALPGNNCGGCGYPGCDGLAKAIARWCLFLQMAR